MSIQEHRFFHPDSDLEYLKQDGYQLVTASATKNSTNATIGGVGILLSPRAQNNILRIEKISPFILVAESATLLIPSSPATVLQTVAPRVMLTNSIVI